MGQLYRPKTATDALACLAASPATLIAGGTDVFPALVDRPPPAALIDLSGIPELRTISSATDTIRIGAATRWSDISRATLPPAFHMLKQAAQEIGSIQIQNRATIGGNLCNASPAADGVPPLLALDAVVELLSPRGVRRMPLSDFIVDNRRTQRADDEIMTAIVVPRAHENARSTFLKLGARKYLVISIVMVAVLLDVNGDDRIRAARIAVGSASKTARRLPALEARLLGLPSGPALADLVTDADMSALAPIDDIRATASYRLYAARTLITRALSKAAGGVGV